MLWNIYNLNFIKNGIYLIYFYNFLGDSGLLQSLRKGNMLFYLNLLLLLNSIYYLIFILKRLIDQNILVYKIKYDYIKD